MSYSQIKPFDKAKGGTTPNFCLANVTKGFGIPNRFSSAWEAWKNTEQHSGEAPAGLDVPVYFSYSATIDGIYQNWGHIGVRLANGQFWSDGKVYSSVSAYTANHSPRYVGWGESVNEVAVIKQGEQMIQETTAEFNRFRDLFMRIRGRDPSIQEFRNVAVGKTWLRVIEVLSDDPEARDVQRWQELAPSLSVQVNELQNQVAQLKAEQANADEANLLGQALIKLLSTFGYKKS